MNDFIPASHHDLEIRIDANLGKQLLHSLEFPLQIDFPEDELAEMDLEVSEEQRADAEEERHEDGIEAIVEDVLIQPLVDHLDRTHTDSRATARSAEKRYQVIVRSLAVIIPSAPELNLGNPIEIGNITMRVKADIKVGVRILGKWRWKDTSTPWLNLEGRKATLGLEAQDSRLMVIPELEDTGMALTLTIWKWQLKCKLGISRWINRQLLKRGPFKAVDFADLHLGAQLLGKTPTFAIRAVSNTKEFLEIKADVSWQ